MRTRRKDSPIRIAIATGLLLLAACAEKSPEPAPPEPDSASSELPPGHPPLEGLAPPQTVAPVDPQLGVGETALEWDVPPAWSSEAPDNSMRRAQYRVPGGAGDGACIVYYFGPGKGGDAMPNAVRWANQFKRPDGSPATPDMKTEERNVNGLEVLMIEVSGTYSTGGPAMGGTGEELPGYRLLGAVAEGPDANWFFKFTGPEATVEEHRSAFEELIASLRAGGNTPTT